MQDNNTPIFRVSLSNGTSRDYTEKDYRDLHIADWLNENHNGNYSVYKLNDAPADTIADDQDYVVSFTKDGQTKSKLYSGQEYKNLGMSDWLEKEHAGNYQVQSVRGYRDAYLAADEDYWKNKADEQKAAIDKFDQDNHDFMFKHDMETKLYQAGEGNGISDDYINDDAKYRELVRQRQKLQADLSNNPYTKSTYKANAEYADEKAAEYDDIINGMDPQTSEEKDERTYFKQARKLQKDVAKIYSVDTMKDPGENTASDYLKNFIKGHGDTFSDIDFWTMNFTEISRNLNVRDIMKGLQNKGVNLLNATEKDIDDNLTPGEKALLQAFFMKSEAEYQRAKDMAPGYTAGQTSAESLEFMAEFLISGGIGRGLAAAGAKGLKSWIGRAIRTGGENAIRSSVKRGMIGAFTRGGEKALTKGMKTATDIASKAVSGAYSAGIKPIGQAVWHTAVQPSTYRTITENMTQIQDNGELMKASDAIWGGVLDQMIENWSESMGGAVETVLGAPFKLAGWSGEKILGKTTLGQWGKWLADSQAAKVLHDAGFNGLIGEMGEEWLGNAVRVGFGLMSGDKFKDFASWHEQLEMAASFAPISLFGLGTTTYAASRQAKNYKRTAEAMRGVLNRAGMTEDEIANIMDTKHTKQEIADALTPVIQRIVHGRETNDTAMEDYITTLRFAQASAMNEVLATAQSIEKETARKEKRNDIARDLGAKGEEVEIDGEKKLIYTNDERGKFTHIMQTDRVDAEGKPYELEAVTTVKDADGNEWFYMGSDGSQVVLKKIGTEGGKPMFLTQEQYAQRVESGEYVENTQLATQYLDEQIEKERAAEERNRRNKELQDKYNAVAQRIQVGSTIDLGTEDAPMKGVVMAMGRDGVIVDFGDPVLLNGETLQIHRLSLEQAGNAVGVDASTKSDEQQERDAIDREDTNRKRIDALNKTFRDKDFTVNGDHYVYTRMFEAPFIDENGTEVAKVTATDELGKEVEVTVPLQELQEQALTTEEQDRVDAEQDNTDASDDAAGRLKDFRGNDIPMHINEKTGEEEVDKREFKKRDPEAYYRWNDSRRGGDTSDSMEAIQADITAKTKQKEEYVSKKQAETDPDLRDELEGQITRLDNDINLLAGIYHKYDAASNFQKAQKQYAKRFADIKKNLLKAKTQEQIDDLFAMQRNVMRDYLTEMQDAAQTISLNQHAVDLQNEINGIADLPVQVTTYARVESDMINDGADRASIDKVLDKIASVQRENMTSGRHFVVDGFHRNGKVYIFAEGNADAEAAAVTYYHERQHNVNMNNPGAVNAVLDQTNDRNALYETLDRIIGDARAYESASARELADEIVAFTMEKAFTNPDYVNEMKGLGLSDRLINIITKEYGRQQGTSEDFTERSGNGNVDVGESGQTNYRINEQTRERASGEEQLGAVRHGTESAEERQHVTVKDAEEDLASKGIASGSGDARFSVRYVPDASETESIVKDIMLETGVPEDVARAWIASETSLAAIISDEQNSPYLNYEGDDRYTAIKKDGDYPQGTVDFNNICRKRLPFTAMYQRIQKQFPNKIITGEDLAVIRQIMKDRGLMVACGLCYVEDRMQLLGEIARDFINEYHNDFKGYASKEGNAKKRNAEKFRELLGDDRKDDLSIYDLLTLDGSLKLYQEHRGIYDAFNAFNNARGQAAGNLFQGYAEYKREILNWSKSKVKQVNALGGLRVFSYSDFEAHHLIDLVQIIQDCARKGVMIQGYTKVPAFARVVADTGVKLNRSLIPLGDTGIVDGKLAFDPVEGIDINDPDFLPSNNNIGNILIGINDEQIGLAMLDPFVHFIIPYHSNQSGILRKLKQTGAWTNYKSEQTDKDLKTGRSIGHGINIYTDVLDAAAAEGKPIRNEREFVDKFLAVCKERGLRPRFSRFLNIDDNGNFAYRKGYYKFLVDFKMFDEEGNILPQYPVQANFDDAFNKTILDKYVADTKAETQEGLDGAYDEIVDKLGLKERPDDVRFRVKEGSRTEDRQGNPIKPDGTLYVETVSSIDKITDEDFTNPTRSIALPKIPENVDNAIGANGKPVIIKKNIFKRNSQVHPEVSPQQAREILSSALYRPDLYGQNQKTSRPYNWIVISTKDSAGQNRLVVLEVNENKDNVEIIHWYNARNSSIEQIKRQAQKEGGLILILPSETEEAGGLSSRQSGLSFENKDTKVSDNNIISSKESAGTIPSQGLEGDSSARIAEANREQKMAGGSYLSEVDPDIIAFRLSNNNRATISKWLDKWASAATENAEGAANNREPLKKDVLEYLDQFDDATLQLAWAKWFCTGAVRMGAEDMPKVRQALKLAKAHKVDPLQYDSPMSIINQWPGEVKEEPINPNDVKTLHKAKELSEGIIIYDVDESDESRNNMRQIINTHFGKDCSPWCLLQGDGKGNLTESSEKYWEHYDSYPKQVAFKDGKLLAFSANDSEDRVWWDRQDERHDNIPVVGKIKGDRLGRSGSIEYNPETGAIEGVNDIYKGNRMNGVFMQWHSLEDDIPYREETYKDGKLDGRSIWRNSNSQIMADQTFKDGVLDGKATIYHDNGNLEEEQMYANGQLNGERIQYYEDGITVQNRGMYKDSHTVGKHTEYFRSGSVMAVREYDDNGKPTGHWKNFREDGTLSDEQIFENGKLMIHEYAPYGLETRLEIFESTSAGGQVKQYEMYRRMDGTPEFEYERVKSPLTKNYQQNDIEITTDYNEDGSYKRSVYSGGQRSETYRYYTEEANAAGVITHKNFVGKHEGTYGNNNQYDEYYDENGTLISAVKQEYILQDGKLSIKKTTYNADDLAQIDFNIDEMYKNFYESKVHPDGVETEQEAPANEIDVRDVVEKTLSAVNLYLDQDMNGDITIGGVIDGVDYPFVVFDDSTYDAYIEDGYSEDEVGRATREQEQAYFAVKDELEHYQTYGLWRGEESGPTFRTTEQREPYVSFSIVEDPKLIEKLDEGDKVKVYRAMQMIDGKLYPPMASKINREFVQPIELGKWEQADEHPELIDKEGRFKLNKGNGKGLKAAYNPYIHTSRTPLNDQFSEAQSRPNIVTVEVEIPKSELSSGYKADKAKDSVGEIEWKAGIVQGQLTGTRKVILTRWDKPIRIVPDSEVASIIVNDMFKGKTITMPTNVVTPSLRVELEKLGVPFVQTDNTGHIVGGEYDGKHYSQVYGNGASTENSMYMKAPKEKLTHQSRPAFRTTEQREQLFKDAKDEFGTTTDFREAGYLLPDGSMLDFSEKRDGGPAGQRSQDHRSISRVMNDVNYDTMTEYLDDFMNEGAIRLLPESGTFSIAKQPTKAQKNLLRDFIYRYDGEVEVEYYKDGHSVADPYYRRRTSPTRVLNDIDKYFTDGTIPEGNGPMFRTLPISPEMRDKMSVIEAIARMGGTYLKAPNGADTRLDPEQWALVRTDEFKSWFGDWEKAARIEKLRKSEPVTISGQEYEGKYELIRESAKAWMKDNLRGSYKNEDTKNVIAIGRKGVNKVTSHSMGSEAHLKSIAAIPEMLKKAIFITREQASKAGAQYPEYEYYVVGLKIGDVDYTAKVTIGVDENGNKFYDHALTEIEKGKLLDQINGQAVSPGFISTEINPSVTKSKDTKLFSILQTNSSKVVDENGEPKVVYQDAPYRFIESGDAEPVFLNIKSLLTDDVKRDYNNGENLSSMDPVLQNAKQMGYDGVVFTNIAESWQNGSAKQYVVFEPSQIKSAVDNEGTVDAEQDDIRFRTLDEANDRFNSDKEKGLKYLSSASQYVQQEIDKQDLSSAAKIVKDFKNPIIPDATNVNSTSDLRKQSNLDAEHMSSVESGDDETMERPFEDVMFSVRSRENTAKAKEGLQNFDKETVSDMLMKTFSDVPEDIRAEITDRAFNNGFNFGKATVNYFADLAEREDDLTDKEQKAVATMRDNMKAALGLDNLSLDDTLWSMFQTSMDGGRDILTAARRAIVADKLCQTPADQARRKKADDEIRFSIRREMESTSAAEMYNSASSYWANRLKESGLDMYESVNDLIEAIEKSTGKKAGSFEDIRLALNQQSSKGLAAMSKYTSDYLEPLWDAIKDVMQASGMEYDDVVRYVMLKHAIERNTVFAKRDAKAFYQAEFDNLVDPLKKERKELEKDRKKALASGDVMAANNCDIRIQTIDLQIAAAQAKLDRNNKMVNNGTSPKYREFRENDYGGLTSMYSEYPGLKPRKDYKSDNDYNRAARAVRKPLYQTVADMEAAAQKEVNAAEARVTGGQFDELWDRINAATKATLASQYKSNVISKAQYEAARDQFKYYVPLRGFKDDTAEDIWSYFNDSRSGSFAPSLIKAKGRKSEAENPFNWIGTMASSAIAQNIKNESKLALYYFISNRPNQDIVAVKDVWYQFDAAATAEYQKNNPGSKKRLFSVAYPPLNASLDTDAAKAAYDLWEEDMVKQAQQGLAYRGSNKPNVSEYVAFIEPREIPQHIIRMKLRGKDVCLIINGNPRAAQAINGMLNIETEGAYKMIFGPVLRFMSAVRTSYNPEFWISNAQRDLLMAAMGMDIRGYGAGNFVSNVVNPRKIMRMMKDYKNGTLGNSEMENYYREFAESGAITGFTVVNGNDYWEKQINEFIDKSTFRKAVEKVKFDKFLQHWQDLGEAVEQMTRFSAFVSSRKAGEGIVEATNLAKEISVNFNRKGSGQHIKWKELDTLTTKDGRPLSQAGKIAVYTLSLVPAYGRHAIMFFNAAIQGLNSMYKLWKINPKRFSGWMAGYFAIGVMQALLHALMDDDDDYLDINDYTRRNNLLLGYGGLYFKWSMPQEARAFYAMGDMFVNSLMGRTPDKNVVWESAKAFLDVMPISVDDGILGALPSVLQPAMDIARNKDFAGARIYNDMRFLSEDERSRTPKYPNALPNTGKVFINISKVLNNLSGGSEWDAGAINIHPEAIQHIVENAGGGLLTTFDKIYETIGGAVDMATGLPITGEELSVRRFPFLNRILQVNDERTRNAHVSELFYFYKSEAEHTKTKLRKLKKNGDYDELDKLLNSEEFEIYGIYQKYEKLMKRYNEQIKIEDNKDERKMLMREQDEYRKEMIREISEID